MRAMGREPGRAGRWLGLWWLAAAGAAAAQTNAPERLTVPAEASRTGQAFTFERTFRERLRNHRVYDLRFPSPVRSPFEANNTVPGELYVPAGAAPDGRFPAVLCMHILNGNFELSRLLCTRLSEHGVVALFFKQPYYGERGGAEGRHVMAASADLFVGAMEQGIEDARRALDLLSALPETDRGKLGVTGISLGALQATVVAGRDPRVQRAFLTLAGSGLRQIVEHARETRGLRAAIAAFPAADQARVWACIEGQEPLAARDALRRLAAADRLRLVCAEHDQVLPPAGGVRLAEAAGCADRIIWLKGMDHYTAMAGFPAVLEQVVAFFGADVPADWRPEALDGAPTPLDLIGRFLAGLAAVLGGQPEASRAHLLGLEASVTASGKRYEGRADYAVGGQGRFKLSGVFPEVGAAGLGVGDYPWLIGGGARVFCGTLGAVPGRLPAAFILPQHLMRFQVGAGALAGAALAPEALKPYAAVTETNGAPGERVLELAVARKRAAGTVRLGFARDEEAPRWVSWTFPETEGTVRVTHWRLNAVVGEGFFDAPPGLPRQEVRQDDLLRMFAAVFQFAMEATE